MVRFPGCGFVTSTMASQGNVVYLYRSKIVFSTLRKSILLTQVLDIYTEREAIQLQITLNWVVPSEINIPLVFFTLFSMLEMFLTDLLKSKKIMCHYVSRT